MSYQSYRIEKKDGRWRVARQGHQLGRFASFSKALEFGEAKLRQHAGELVVCDREGELIKHIVTPLRARDLKNRLRQIYAA